MWPFSSPPKLYTGRLITGDAVRAAFGGARDVMLGKTQYAEVNSKAVVWLAQQARNALFSQGITRWRDDATCTVFASKFCELGNELFFAQAFQDPISENICALAVGEFWFRPDNSPAGAGHAIGVAITEIGALYIDPQAPDTLRPTSVAEIVTAYNCRFL